MPLQLFDMLYQKDGGFKLLIDVIRAAKALWVLINECLSYTIGSELLLLNNIVRRIGRHFVTFTSLGDNEQLMTKHRPIINTNLLNVDTTVNNNSGVTMKLQR